MTKVNIATRDVYNSDTGEFFRPGDVIPDTKENEIVFETKLRRGKTIVPGVDENVKVTETKVAGGDKPREGAGQNGQKPSKRKPAATIAELEAATDNVEVEEGGKPRTKDVVVNGDVVTPAGGKVQPVPSVLD